MYEIKFTIKEIRKTEWVCEIRRRKIIFNGSFDSPYHLVYTSLPVHTAELAFKESLEKVQEIMESIL